VIEDEQKKTNNAPKKGPNSRQSSHEVGSAREETRKKKKTPLWLGEGARAQTFTKKKKKAPYKDLDGETSHG